MKYQVRQLITLFLREDEQVQFLKALINLRGANHAERFLSLEWLVEDIEGMMMSSFVFADSENGAKYWWAITNRAVRERDAVAHMLLIDRDKIVNKYANEDKDREEEEV